MSENKQLSNPYRKMGTIHNAGLDFLIGNLKPKEVTIEKIIDNIGLFMEKVNDTESKIDFATYCGTVVSAINRNNQVPFDEILRELKVTKEGRCFINDILNVSEDYDYPTALKVVENIELNILTSEMTQEERQYPLIMVAIAKSSIEYWIKQINDKKSPWIPFVEGGDLARRKWPWKSDARGGTALGISGLVTGGWLGGLLGGIGGAIGFSVSDFFFPKE